jgi:hypothetical protein
LPHTIVPTIDLLDEVFPLVAAAYRRAEVADVRARINNAGDEYEDDPDDATSEILKLYETHNPKLYFARRGELARFLLAYEDLLPGYRRRFEKRS